MTVAIHQPHFMPWLGYFDRMLQADMFILLDHVQFERQNYQNRVQIKTGQGAQWLSVPVSQGAQEERILDKRIDNGRKGRQRWGRKVFLTLQYAYQGAPYFHLYASKLQGIFDARWERLVDLNRELLTFLMEALGVRKPLILSSNLPVKARKSDLVLELCRAVGADTFLGGIGGSREYLDTAAFRQARISVAWQDFQHPRYAQHPRPETFIEGLSALDLLFNCGHESVHILAGKALCRTVSVSGAKGADIRPSAGAVISVPQSTSWPGLFNETAP
jgi:hypothetical protein